jgi:hypothetical protein
MRDHYRARHDRLELEAVQQGLVTCRGPISSRFRDAHNCSRSVAVAISGKRQGQGLEPKGFYMCNDCHRERSSAAGHTTMSRAEYAASRAAKVHSHSLCRGVLM